MYRILIADDEQDERNVIRFLLNRYHFPLEILEAVNGKEALALLQKESIQILFTDIQMPFINGMDLATEVRALYPDMQIIFFSGYDDFIYVKEALSLRVVNYILKPVNPEELKKTITTVLEDIKSKELADSKEKVNADFVRNHILYQVINGTSQETLKKSYHPLETSFLTEFHRLILIQFETDFFGSLIPHSDLDSFLVKTKYLVPDSSFLINLNPSQSLFLFTNELPLEIYKESAQQLLDFISTTWKMDCYISISDTISNPEQIAIAYQKTEAYLENRFFYSNQYIYYPHMEDITMSLSPEQDDILLKSIEKDIEFKDTVSLKQNVDLLLGKYEKKATISHIYIRYLCTNLLQLLLQNNCDYTESDFQNNTEKIYSFRHFSDINMFIRKALDVLILNLSKEQQPSKHVIYLVEQYIHNNYSQDLSLNILSEKVFLTPRYLSSMFIQETGCGLSKYIKNVRMERAKELLLLTNMKVADICQSVGYSNVSYFCKSFQEDFGTTPDKYRQNPT